VGFEIGAELGDELSDLGQLAVGSTVDLEDLGGKSRRGSASWR
jgi:hypothetical protein